VWKWGDLIQGFRHKGLRQLFETGSNAGIQPSLARKLSLQLAALNSAAVIEDLDLRGTAYICSRQQTRGAGQSGPTPIGA
jgi:plasmid maintenance system killer protein